MAFQPKIMKVERISPVDNLPVEFPRFPEDVLERFPSLTEYQRNLDRWWFDVQTVLQRQAKEISEAANEAIKPVVQTP